MRFLWRHRTAGDRDQQDAMSDKFSELRVPKPSRASTPQCSDVWLRTKWQCHGLAERFHPIRYDLAGHCNWLSVIGSAALTAASTAYFNQT